MDIYYLLVLCCTNREYYQRYSNLIPKSNLKDTLDRLYKNPNLNSVTFEQLQLAAQLDHPKSFDPSIFESLKPLFNQKELLPNIESLVLRLYQKNLCKNLIENLNIFVNDGDFVDFQTIQKNAKLLVELPIGNDATKPEYHNDIVPDDLEVLLHTSMDTPGLKFRLKSLNMMLGCLRTGNFGFIFARPEAGKTTLLAYEGVNFASQLPEGRPYIHFNNEEDGYIVKIRYYQAALGLTTEELATGDRNSAYKKFMELTKGNLVLLDRPYIHRKYVEQVCQNLNPGFVVMDSIDKIKGFDNYTDRDDLRYKMIYQWARELSKEYGPVIGTCHASAEAEGRKWLNMDDVAYAKTAKQGEADWILGIGKSNESGTESTRYLSVSKNKLIGDSDLQENLRHGKLAVQILSDVAQYQDLIGNIYEKATKRSTERSSL